MMYGVFINGIDTLSELGLFLCDDLKIGEAKLNEVKTKIPGSNRVLDSSYVLSGGEPTFDPRPISFSLNAKSKAQFERAIDKLYMIHGRRAKLVLPDDLEHFWDCTISFVPEKKTGVNKIAVKAKAYPYKLRHSKTERTVTSPGTVQFENEGKRAFPTFTLVSGSAAVSADGIKWHTIQSDMENVFEDVYIAPGGSELVFKFSGSVKIEYQEEKL